MPQKIDIGIISDQGICAMDREERLIEICKKGEKLHFSERNSNVRVNTRFYLKKAMRK